MFGNGLATINGTLVGPSGLFGAGRSMEFVGAFTTKANQHVGFSGDLTAAPSVGDFHQHLEWRWPNHSANAGEFLDHHTRGKPMPAFPAPTPAPAQFASAEQARASARAFELKKIGPTTIANPYPLPRAARARAGARMPDGSYFLSRYADCIAVYKDTAAYSLRQKARVPTQVRRRLLYEHHTTSLIFNDPPLHTRVRKIIAGALRRVPSPTWRRPWWRWSTACSIAMAAKGSADLIADLAAAVPVEVIGNLLAVPRDERGPLRDWSLAILGALEPVISRAAPAWRTGGGRVRRLSAPAGRRPARASGRSEPRRAHAPDPGRGRRRAAVRARAAAQHHLHPECRPRDHHQPDRQRPRVLLEWPQEKARLIASRR